MPLPSDQAATAATAATTNQKIAIIFVGHMGGDVMRNCVTRLVRSFVEENNAEVVLGVKCKKEELDKKIEQAKSVITSKETYSAYLKWSDAKTEDEKESAKLANEDFKRSVEVFEEIAATLEESQLGGSTKSKFVNESVKEFYDTSKNFEIPEFGLDKKSLRGAIDGRVHVFGYSNFPRDRLLEWLLGQDPTGATIMQAFYNLISRVEGTIAMPVAREIVSISQKSGGNKIVIIPTEAVFAETASDLMATFLIENELPESVEVTVKSVVIVTKSEQAKFIQENDLIKPKEKQRQTDKGTINLPKKPSTRITNKPHEEFVIEDNDPALKNLYYRVAGEGAEFLGLDKEFLRLADERVRIQQVPSTAMANTPFRASTLDRGDDNGRGAEASAKTDAQDKSDDAKSRGVEQKPSTQVRRAEITEIDQRVQQAMDTAFAAAGASFFT